MIPVSVVIVTKDEVRNIRDALESVREFEDVVVLDAFSADGTVEICREYTPRVFQKEWMGYARQKQAAVDLAKKEWVLILDADERVTAELKRELVVKITGGTYDGYYLPRKNFFLGKWIRHSGWWPDYTLRLFRREVSHVEYREVHEKVVVKGPVSYLEGPVEHYSYRTIADYLRKMEHYSTLSADEFFRKKSALPLLSMVANPVHVFIKMFFLRQGFRDGMHGFILAGLYSCYTFLKYAKIWEKRRDDRGHGIT
ncbi:MAG TPA: glycosyltransferase family 2 protein [Thermodesulfovibrionales bacterium]|nr:glycosyltransferase family 2 protein [Thermodesulfovibrionales bacterium]